MKTKKIFSVVLIYAMFITAFPIFAQTPKDSKGLGIKTVSNLPSKDKRWALIIGVDDYQDDNISDLRGAANDAKYLADSLEKYAGFPQDQIILLSTSEPSQRQPTRANILKRLSNLKNLVPKDGLLLVSFSGHGIERGNKAFLIPSDATSTDDVELLEDTALSVENMKRQVKNTQVQQVLFLIDACRNDPTSGRSESTNALTEAYKRGFSFDVKNKEIEAFATIYATSVGARAYEYAEKRQGYFSWAIVEALSGKAANSDGEVTLGSLVKYIENRVPKLVSIDLGAGKVQRPFAVIEGYKADELVLSISGTVPPIPSPLPTPNVDTDKSGEEVYWEEVSRLNTKSGYQSYVNEYPSGKYITTARQRIQNIDAAASNNAREAEKQKWGEAERLNTIESYQSYINSYPNGEYKSIANLRITNLSASAETAKLRNPRAGMTMERPIGNGLMMRFMGIPSGTFMMGSPASEDKRDSDEGPQRRVTISEGYWMSKYEVTQEEYEAVMGTNPSYFKNCPKCPVEMVSWNDAKEYIKRLNAKNDGNEYRLPSEAEWEYAARAGTTGAFGIGDGNNLTSDEANFDGNYPYGGAAKGKYIKKTTPVGSYKPNKWGLYDMHGNVLEWCEDIYSGSYTNLSTDGAANMSIGDSSIRVLRGGSWNSYGGNLRSANRGRNSPDNRSNVIGFRLVVRPK